ncbi:hypothetical protein [Deinococcus marmoris]|uniref:Uncharacterized protein n=1 Tax=Deinococcus marmoris TaxID=249408 RepID=A0A1U7P2Z2_9DEIO|nr:hypothetical protein [Deinococcus marmoris]OLV19529.1 hypothetical protein BOO71_0002326 [Deinococcus marmoris]
MKLSFEMFPSLLPVIAVSLDVPESGERVTGVLTVAGDGEALAYTQDIALIINIEEAGQISSETWGPFKGVGHFSHTPETGITVIALVHQGSSQSGYPFTPRTGQTVGQNLNLNWPDLIGINRIPAWLLNTPVNIPLEAALAFEDHYGFFDYLLGAFGYSLIESEAGLGWVLGGGAVGDVVNSAQPFTSGPRNVDTLSVPRFMTVRGKEEIVDTPPPETAEQEARRLRVAAIMQESHAQGRISDEEVWELSKDGVFEHEEFTADRAADEVGYQKVTETKTKVNFAVTQEVRTTINIQPVTVTGPDGERYPLTARSTDTTTVNHSYGMLQTRRVSTGSTTVTETAQQLIGTAPTLDPPLDIAVYGSRTTTATRKTWTPGGWVRLVSVTTVVEQLKDNAVIYSATSTDITSWVRSGSDRWSSVQQTSSPTEAPVYDDEDEVAYYINIPQVQTRVSPDSGPPEMAPQSDDGLRNLSGETGGAAKFSVTPEVVKGTLGYGEPVTIDIPWLAGQSAVQDAADLAATLRGRPRHSYQRTYALPSGLRRGDAVRSLSVVADMRDLEMPYSETVETSWTA